MNWYVIHCKPKQEHKAAELLRDQLYNVFLPEVYSDPKSAKNNKPEPMFPCYLFVQLEIGQDEINPIKCLPPVNKLVTFGLTEEGEDYMPAVPDAHIEALRSQQDNGGIIHIYKDFQQGDQVRIKAGMFHGYYAQFIKQAGENRAWILLDSLQKIKIPKSQLEVA